MEILKPLFGACSDDGRYVLMNKGRLTKKLQAEMGDVVMQKGDGVLWVESKAERANKYGNFFLEEWSNRSRNTPGWMFKLNTDFLFYHFLKEEELYIMRYQELNNWALLTPNQCGDNGGVGRMYDYELKQQRVYKQANDTWGRCVPIHELAIEIKVWITNPNDPGRQPMRVRPDEHVALNELVALG